MSMIPRCREAKALGRSGLRHVDNHAIAGHFDADTPPRSPGIPIPQSNVPHDGPSHPAQGCKQAVTRRLTSELARVTNLS